MTQWYEELFRDYAGKYEKESYVTGIDLSESMINRAKENAAKENLNTEDFEMLVIAEK
jgi:ubiquinone/menaquinone biosynthesis C-methylase UbiE